METVIVFKAVPRKDYKTIGESMQAPLGLSIFARVTYQIASSVCIPNS